MTEKWRKLPASSMLKLVFWLFTLAFLVAALVSPDRAQLWSGLKAIYTTPAQVTKDYFEVGSVSAAFFNAFLVSLVCSLLYMLPGAAANGTSFIGFGLTIGFSFWGMHVFNVVPCMLGVGLYCLVKREKLAKNVNFVLFSTGIAPIVTDMFLRYPGLELHGYTVGSVILGLAVGLFIGFFTPGGCAYSANAHKGFSLYSAALPIGMTAFLLRAVLYTVLGGQLPPVEAVLGPSRPGVFYEFLGTMFVLCMLLGLWKNGWSFRGYGKLLRASGHKTDFSSEFGPAVALINIGVYGLFLMLYYTLIRGSLNGATLGLVLCMVACAVAGSHPGNVWPIMVGYVAASFLAKALCVGENFTLVINAQAIMTGMCYANGLSPVAGKYGWPVGIVAGMLHYILVTCVPALHGGYLLYNGGFTACLVCLLLLPTLERFCKTKEERLAAKAR